MKKNASRNHLILSFAILVAFLGLISFIASPGAMRYSWEGINPWNSVLGITDLFKRFLRADPWIIYTLTALLLGYLWWRIFALIKRFRKN